MEILLHSEQFHQTFQLLSRKFCRMSPAQLTQILDQANVKVDTVNVCNAFMYSLSWINRPGAGSIRCISKLQPKWYQRLFSPQSIVHRFIKWHLLHIWLSKCPHVWRCWFHALYPSELQGLITRMRSFLGHPSCLSSGSPSLQPCA